MKYLISWICWKKSCFFQIFLKFYFKKLVADIKTWGKNIIKLDSIFVLGATFFPTKHPLFYWLCMSRYIQLWTKLYIRLAISRSKMGLRNWAWQRVKVVSRPWAPRSTLALIRPLKWGTLRLWTPTGSKNTSRQSWMIEKNVRFSTKTEPLLTLCWIYRVFVWYAHWFIWS